MDFDAIWIYISAMYDKKSVYHDIETGFAFKLHMNNVYVKSFNDQTFNKDGYESAVSKTKCYSPPDLIFEHLPVKEKVKNIEVTRMRNGYFIGTLTSVDIEDIVKIGGKVIQIYAVFLY